MAQSFNDQIPPFTYVAQVALLTSQGLVIDHGDEKILENLNYYRLINCFKEHFINPAQPDHYLPHANLKEIYALYLFDHQLRSLLLSQLLLLEVYMKAIVAYEFSFSKIYTQHPHYPLLHKSFSGNRAWVKKVLEVIHEKNQTTSTYSQIKRQRDSGKPIPIWITIEELTFANVSQFLSIFPTGLQRKVYQRFYVQVEKSTITKTILKEWLADLKKLVLLRNFCAHNSQIYNVKIENHSLYQLLNIMKLLGENDPYINQQYLTLEQNIQSSITELKTKITSIPIETITAKMH